MGSYPTLAWRFTTTYPDVDDRVGASPEREPARLTQTGIG